ncbi:MAG: Asp23/Gls24 family envelope stress response protein [Verrucomicrobia bacterium]|nr:Asp23/Gls24 family envelope stress response protein [Verrucomicrobiota bacterium]
MHNPLKQIDTKEIELPETVFIRDIESKVFQSIVLQSLSQIEGVETLEGNLFDSLLGDSLDGIKGIHVDQDQKNHSVNVRVEINVAYGICIPDKAEEVQNKILQEISRLTSLHVGTVHVIFKNLVSPKPKVSIEEMLEKRVKAVKSAPAPSERYDEVF